MVVMVKVPLWVVGVPSYMYCMLFCTVLVREALRSIFEILTGSRVSCAAAGRSWCCWQQVWRWCRSPGSRRCVVPCRYSCRPPYRRRSRGLARSTSCLVCPKASPMVGRNPGEREGLIVVAIGETDVAHHHGRACHSLGWSCTSPGSRAVPSAAR